MAPTVARTQRLSELFAFCIVNAGLYWLLGLFYLYSADLSVPHNLSWFNFSLMWFYIGITLIGYLGLFALGLFLLLIPTTLLWPNRLFNFSLAVLYASALLFILLADGIAYNHYHFHLNGVLWSLALHQGMNQIFALSGLELALIVACSITVLFIQIGIAFWAATGQRISYPRFAKNFSLTIIGCTLFSYLLFLLAATNTYITEQGLLRAQAISSKARILPFYIDALASVLPVRNALGHLERSGEGMFWQPAKPTQPLRYPIHPLSCTPPKQLPNILIIGLDAWRLDKLKARYTPNLYAFSQQAQQFLANESGGNATEPGLFSIFYSIPVSYWSAMLQQQQAPLLLDYLRSLGYDMGIYTSARNDNPPYNKTLFLHVPHLATQTIGRTPLDRDQTITNKAIDFIHQPRQHPFFSFVFYNASHSYCDTDNLPLVFQPQVQTCNRLLLNNHSDPIPYLNRYLNAAHADDALAGKVLAALTPEQRHHTIVILLGDHGEEFNDSQQNAWGHAGNFTRFQVQTPLVFYWPGKSPTQFHHRTSHYDIVPTLLQEVFHCSNPSSDYSIGHDIFSGQAVSPMIYGSYINYGMNDGKHITVIYSTGGFSIKDQNFRTQPHAKLNIAALKKVFHSMQYYFKSAHSH